MYCLHFCLQFCIATWFWCHVQSFRTFPAGSSSGTRGTIVATPGAIVLVESAGKLAPFTEFHCERPSTYFSLCFPPLRRRIVGPEARQSLIAPVHLTIRPTLIAAAPILLRLGRAGQSLAGWRRPSNLIILNHNF